MTKTKDIDECFYEMIKTILIKQNKKLLKEIAKITDKSEEYLFHVYLKPEYYLPIILPYPQE